MIFGIDPNKVSCYIRYIGNKGLQVRNAKDRHITRMKKALHGWDGFWVRLLDKNRVLGSSQYVSCTFPLSNYGNKVGVARDAATLWRDNTMKMLGMSTDGTWVVKGGTHLIALARSYKKGFQPELPIGVSENKRPRLSGGNYCYFISIISHIPMDSLRAYFKYDESIPGDRDRALKLATKQRKKWEKIYYKNPSKK